MSKRSEEEIEQKLRALEAAMKEDTGSNVPAHLDKSTGLQGHSADSLNLKSNKDYESGGMKADMQILGGFTALLVGILVLFSNLQVNTWRPSFFGLGGGSGSGIMILLLVVGIGFFFYDYKNKIGWLLIAVGIASLIFSIFASLQVYFVSMNLLSFLFIFLPIALGGGLLARGIKMQKQIQDKKKSE